MNRFNIDQLPKNPRILIIKLRSIGDVVYNTSIYEPIKKALPGAHLSLIVEKFTLDIVKNNPHLDEVLCFEKKPLLRQIAFYLKLFFTKYDVVIDMHGGPRSSLMALISGAKHRIGNKLSKRAKFYNIPLQFTAEDYSHPLYNQIGYITKIGIPVKTPKPEIFLSKERVNSTKELLKSKGITEETPFCILHIGSKKKCCDWKAENYAAVIDYCSEKKNLKVVINTIPSMADFTQEIIKNLRTTAVLIINGLQEAAAMAQEAEFVISQDGGYIHISSAVGTPVIAIFGPTNVNWLPKGDLNKLVSKNLDCSPCSQTVRLQPGKEECNKGNAECMRLITAKDISEKVDELMQELTLKN